MPCKEVKSLPVLSCVGLSDTFPRGKCIASVLFISRDTIGLSLCIPTLPEYAIVKTSLESSNIPTIL